MKAIGIDIGTYSIKVSEMEISSQDYRLNSVWQIPLSTEPKADKKLEIVEALRQISSHYEGKNVNFILGVPQNKISSRNVSFPFKERHKIIKSLPFELEDDIPFSFHNAVYEARITSYTGKTAQVLATATPHEFIEEFIELCKDGNIDLTLLSIEGLAFSNLFEPWMQAPKQRDELPAPNEEDEEADQVQITREAQIVLDLGHSKTTVLIVCEEQLLDIRTIDWGGSDLALAICNEYKMHYSEALEELQSKGFLLIEDSSSTKEQIKASNVLKRSIDKMNHELQLILLELTAEHNLQFTQASLMGGVSQLRNIGAYITQAIEIPCNRFHYTQLLPKVINPPKSEDELTSAVATGLAIEGFRKARNPAINLLKGPFAQSSQVFDKYWEKWGTTVKFISATFILFCAYSCARDQIAYDISFQPETALKKSAKKILPNKKDAKRVSKIKKYIKRQKMIIKKADQSKVLKTFRSPLDILKELSSKAPKHRKMKMNIHDIAISGQKMVIKGELSPFSAKKDFESTLRGISLNNKIKDLKYKAKVTSGFTGFGYELQVKRMEIEDN